VRHTDARRLTQSTAREHDRCVTRDLVEPLRDLVGRNPQRTLERHGRIVLSADVDEQRAVRDESRAVAGSMRAAEPRTAEGT
jgi:hypothetical protein